MRFLIHCFAFVVGVFAGCSTPRAKTQADQAQTTAPATLSEPESIIIGVGGNIGGQLFDTSITDHDILSGPVWASENDCPPIPPKQAIALARAELDRDFSDASLWELQGIMLSPARMSGHWIYYVFFERFTKKHVYDGSTVAFCVLMDGRIVAPKKSLSK